MTELDVYKRPPAPAAAPYTSDIDSWISVATAVVKLANEICNTPFVPEGLRGSAPATAAAILAGREMGIGPMTSLQHIFVIKGKPGLSALLMRALIISQGHEWQDVDVSDVRAVVRGRRRGESEWTEASFTAAQAKLAGITMNGYPQDKLYARATVRLARRKFADVIMGMPYSAEELEDGIIPDDTIAEATPALEAPKPATAGRTARRRQAPERREEDASGQDQGMGADRVKPSGSQGTQPLRSPEDPDLPPLPGEDTPGAAPSGSPQPGTADPKLTGAIVGHFTRLGFADGERDQRLAVTSTIIGRDITSSRDLTQTEARLVANLLSRCKDRDRLTEVLTAADKPDGTEGGTDG